MPNLINEGTNNVETVINTTGVVRPIPNNIETNAVINKAEVNCSRQHPVPN